MKKGYPTSLKVRHSHSPIVENLTLAQFENFFGYRYLPHLEYSDYRMEQWLQKKCRTAYKQGKIADYSLWLGHLHKKELAEALFPDVTIAHVNKSIGYGLFTNQPLEEAHFVGEYTGIVQRRNLLFSNINDYCFMYPREWANFKPITINGEKFGNHTRFINHSDTPNMEALSVFFEGSFHILFRTIRKILVGEELTYDYGEYYWRRRKKITYQQELSGCIL